MTALLLWTSPGVHFGHSQGQDIGLRGYHSYKRLYVNVCVQIISHGTISNLNTFQNSILMNTLLSTYYVHQKASFSHYLINTEQLAVGSTSLVTKTKMLA